MFEFTAMLVSQNYFFWLKYSIIYPNHTWLIGSVAQYPSPAPGYGGQTAPVGGALNVTYWGLAKV